MSTKDDPNDVGNKVRVGARAGFANKYPGLITGRKINKAATKGLYQSGPEQKYEGIGNPHGPHGTPGLPSFNRAPSTEIHIHLGDAIKKRMGRRG